MRSATCSSRRHCQPVRRPDLSTLEDLEDSVAPEDAIVPSTGDLDEQSDVDQLSDGLVRRDEADVVSRRADEVVLVELEVAVAPIQRPLLADLRVAEAADREPQPGEPWVASPGTRPGHYFKNFFDEQPALNFGYARTDATEPWRQGVDAAGPQANRAALREIMAFWLDRGVAGFRVDMAYSLVKDDPDREADRCAVA